MLFVIHARDKAGSSSVRAENRDAHITFLRDAGDRLKLAGPLLDDDGSMCGSLLVYEAGDRIAVERWLDADPYGQAGLFETVSISGFKPVLGSMAPAS
tara:strand:- start:1074 stop:1367 length:294 start_codon:yes stop_codon:yes gene_type:complete